MSTTATAADAAVAADAMDRQTYWCHECDMSVSLLPSATAAAALLCPHCDSDFLEELDSPNPNPNPNPNPSNNNQNSNHVLPSFFDPSFPPPPTDATTFHFPAAAPTDDNFLLDSPYFHRLIHHLTNSDESSPATTAATTSHHHYPAARSAVESIPSVKITAAFLEIDPVVICAVCKDQFVVDDETKQLPCKHMYHPDCILPWLSQHNSCPVCRFQLPTEPVAGELKVRRRSRSRVLRLGDLMEDDDDEELLGFGLRHLARRHRLVFPMRHHHYEHPEVEVEEEEPEVLFSSTQIGEVVEVDVLPDSGRTNSVETVSSWPSWPVGGGAADGGEVGVSASRANDDADVVMS